METMQYFFGILKIEKGKQKIYNPEPSADNKVIAQGPFKFIAPVVSLVRRGAMKKDHSYFLCLCYLDSYCLIQDLSLKESKHK